jgi:hypothetical protein
MQDELDAEDLALDVRILMVNLRGAEAGIESACMGRDLCLAQDTEAEKVWESWAVEYRDVVILDAENRVLSVYNLTVHSLAESANYEALKGTLRQAANAGP